MVNNKLRLLDCITEPGDDLSTTVEYEAWRKYYERMKEVEEDIDPELSFYYGFWEAMKYVRKEILEKDS